MTRMLFAGVVLLAVVGCGVRPSGVIVGAPAPRGSAGGVTLYLVSNNKLAPVVRPTGAELSAADRLMLLAAGPDADERAQGFTTEVPSGLISLSGDTVTLSTGVSELSTMAVDQIVCTANDAETPGRIPITLVGGGESRGPQTCPR